MTTKKVIKKKNINIRANIYGDGAFMKFMGNPLDALKGGLGSIGSTLGGIAGEAISGDLDSTAGTVISGLGDIASAIPGPWGAVASAGLKIIGGLTNRAFGTHTDKEALAAANAGTSALNSFTSTAQSFDEVQGPAYVDSVKDVYKGGWFKKKEAEEKNAILREDRDLAQDYANRAVLSNVENIKQDQMSDLLTNYAAYGGLLDFGNIFKQGGSIHIKPQNRGKFTDYCGGNVTAECIARGKRSSSPSIRKRATFADNARKWKHADGGFIDTPTEDEYFKYPTPSYTTVNDSPEYTNQMSDLKSSTLDYMQEWYKNRGNVLLNNEIEYNQDKENIRRLKKLGHKYKSRGNEDKYEEIGKKLRSYPMMPSEYNDLEGADLESSLIIDNMYMPVLTKAIERMEETPAVSMDFDRSTSASGGYYDPNNSYIGIATDVLKGEQPLTPEQVAIHEYTHAANLKAAHNKVGKILIEEFGDSLAKLKNKDKYLDDLSEVYARLNEFRYANNLDPRKMYNEIDVSRMSKKDRQLIERYGPKVVARLLNEVAQNDNQDYSTQSPDTSYFETNFAALGGPLSTHGADFNNGITIIGNGGTHEENPMEGVQMGVDPQGIPNLVEEGEVIFNNYVFSNRIKVPKSVKQKYKIRGSKEMTFADAVKYVQKESEERPNDPISQRGLEINLTKLVEEQEAMREKKNTRNNKFEDGGSILPTLEVVASKPSMKEVFNNPVKLDDTILDRTYMLPEDVYDLGELETPELVEITNPKFKGFGTNEYEQKTLARSLGIDQNNNNNSSTAASMLRYAPAVGSALSLIHNISNKPDYSNAETLMQEAKNAGTYTPVSHKPLSDYMAYNPFDRNYYQNKLNAEAGATRRAIMNTSGPSRNAALLAADYNAQGRLGDLARQAEEYNLAQRQAVAQFNRGTNQANAEMALKASMSNAELAQKAKQSRLAGVQNALAMRESVDATRNAGINSAFSGLMENLGAIGTDILNREDASKVAGSLYKCGGKMKKKRRGGLTY